MEISELQELIQLYQRADARVTEAEEELKAAKERLNELKLDILPTALQEAGVESMSLDDGFTVHIDEDVSVGITEKKRPAALQWLRDNNFGGIIKSVVSVDVTDDAIAQEVATLLDDAGYAPNAKQTVHAGTLKAFVKEQLAAGTDIPFPLFGIHPITQAKIKKGKKQ